MTNKKRVVVVANGSLGDLGYYRSLLVPGDHIICADGGAARALAIGVVPDLVVGDADSLAPETRFELGRLAVPFLSFPAEKDKSDLELALDHAAELNPAEILIIGALGGSRIEHTFASICLLAVLLQKGIPACLADERHEIRLMEKELSVRGSAGDYVSLFPLTPSATGVHTAGLKYPLRGETLYFASTRGLSNELVETAARVTAATGLLLVIKTVKT
jgi:thiamine pyrophosphokinase